MARASIVLAFAAIVVGAPSTLAQPASGDLVIEGAKIRAKNDIEVSAETDGTVTSLPVSEGAEIPQGALLAAIDDRVAKAAVDVATFSLEAARTRAEDKIEELYAKAAAAVALANLEKDLLANARVPHAVPDIEIRKERLEVRRAELQIEKSKKDQVIAGKEADVKEAELRAQQVNLQQRQITAPFSGEVRQIMLHQGEWAQAGQPILSFVQYDVLIVDALVSAREFDPIELANRPVTVVAKLARGKEQTLTGRIVYVEQSVADRTQMFRVRAELVNHRENGYWALRPGLPATMTIHTTQAPVE